MSRAASTCLAGVLILCSSGCTSSPPLPKRCIFITLDTCRADRLTCYGSQTAQTPSLDRLAAAGTLFEDAFAPVPLTLPSHCSMFTGLLVSHHRVRDNAWYQLGSDIPTLAVRLMEAGIETAAVIASFPLERRFGLARGFSHYDDGFSLEPVGTGDPKPWYGHRFSRFERRGEEVTDGALVWLREHGSRGKSFFLWVHYFDPHSPYDPPPLFADRFPNQPYNGEVEAMDHAIGRLLEGVRDHGLEKDTLFVAVGDHGESLGEHGQHGHGYSLYQDTLRVPMIFRLDGVIPAGRRVQDAVQLVDLCPTVLEFFGLTPGVPMDGESLWQVLTKQAPVPRRPAFAETVYPERYYKRPGAGSFCVRVGSWKLIADRQGKPRELYNLDSDPNELTNLKEDAVFWEEAQAAQMLALLRDYLREAEQPSPEPVTKLDTEALEAMKALGYVR